MRCPNCGGLNPDDAAWCGQCFRRFEPEPPPEESPPEPPPEEPPPIETPEPQPLVSEPVETPAPPGAFDPADPLGDAPTRVDDRGFLRSGERLVGWRCPTCESDNPIEANLCSTCGASFMRSVAPVGDEARPEPKEPVAAALLSILPGAGHLYLGKTGEGVGRLLLGAWWLAAAVLLAGAPVLAPLSALFAIGLAFLMGASVFDAYRQAADPKARPILSRQVMLWTTIAFVTLSTVGAALMFLVAQRS